MDLFDAAADERVKAAAPLAARMRPVELDEVVGQSHLTGVGKPLRSLIDNDAIRSVILWGPPGTGKTTIAEIVANKTSREFIKLSAVHSGVKEVRAVIEGARRRLGELGRGTTLFLDEIHRFNKAQQDAFLPAVENGTIVLIGATTENPFFEINTPLLSRALLFRLEAIDDEAIGTLVDRAVVSARGLDSAVTVSSSARAHLVDKANGDARRVLNSLEVAAALVEAERRSVIELVDAEAAMNARLVAYDKGGDQHYDVISAFIKAMRGSDPDAAIYWLARMITAGEDAKFIARRMVILASEDIGLADPDALNVAVAAARALEFVGLPEAALNLGQAVIYLAKAPKSNSVTVALGAAFADVQDRRTEPVPTHLRDSHYRGAKRLGHGAGYIYPHDEPGHHADQDYLPDDLAGRSYYVPSGQGQDV